MEYGLLKNFQVGVLPHGVSPHTHGEFEFHFVARGEGILNWKKERRGVRRGDFFAIPPDEKHFMEQKGGGESMTQIFFTGRFPPEAEDLAVWLTRGRGAGKIFHAGSLRLGFFDQLMRDVGRGGLSARAASFEWLGFLYRLMDASELNAHLADESPVDALLDEMYRSVRRDFDPQSFANKIKIPFAVLARRFQKKMSLTPRQYFLKLRVEAAATELASSDRKIHEIAVDYGFEDQFYFSRIFRKVKGISPQIWRQRRPGGKP